MKKFAFLPLAALAFAAACSDSPTALPPGVEFHVAGEGGASADAHDPELTVAAITAPTGLASVPAGAVTISWDAAPDKDVENYQYRIDCTGSGCTPVSTTTTPASASGTKLATVSISPTLEPGSYTLYVRGTKTSSATFHAPVYKTRSFTVVAASSPPPPADETPPTVSCTVPDQTIWYGSNVEVSCTAGDNGSGLANAADASFTLSTNVAAGSETNSAQTGSKTVYDNARNSVTVGPYTYMVDRKAPTYNCDAAPTGWQGSEVEINCTASDGGSGLYNSPASFTLSTSVGRGNEDGNASTGSQLLEDNVHNQATAGPITGLQVDRKAPVISCGSATTTWYATDQSVNCTASDGGSGLANSADASFSLSTNVAAGTETNNASTGTHSVADAVGNSDTARPVSGFHIDKKGPAVQCTQPARRFLLNQSPADVTATATDGGSGPASQTVSAAANTSSAGSKTVNVSATDNVGNQGSATCAYSVGYQFVGFSKPVENPSVMNVAKAGQAIPLKWRLLDANNVPVANLGTATVTVQSLDCSLGTTTDNVEEYASGSSGLQNLGDGYYQFNWKTPTTYANSCKTMQLNIGEGSTRNALFKFTK